MKTLSLRMTPTSIWCSSIVPRSMRSSTFEALLEGEQGIVDCILNLHVRVVSLLQEGLGGFGVLADGSGLPAVVGARGVQLAEVGASLVVPGHQDRNAEGSVASRLGLLLDVVGGLPALRGHRDGLLVSDPVRLDELARLLAQQSEVRAEARVHGADVVAQKLDFVDGGRVHQRRAEFLLGGDHNTIFGLDPQ